MLRSRIALADRIAPNDDIDEHILHLTLDHKKNYDNRKTMRKKNCRLVWLFFLFWVMMVFVVNILGLFTETTWSTNNGGKKKNTADTTSSSNTWVGPERLTEEQIDEEGKVANEVENSDSSDKQFHIVFSTDCSQYQQWQSFAVFHSAWSVNQPGTVTRIVSGCTEDQESMLQSWHTKYVTPLSSNFFIHFTPHFSSIKDDNGNPLPGKDYEFFNKPLGLLHYMDRYIMLPTTSNKNQQLQLYSHDILILLDPDHILIRPITHDFTPTSTYIPKVRETTFTGTAMSTSIVENGIPFGQRYGFGGLWVDLNLTYITSSTTSPSLRVSRKEAEERYAVGPPYIATVSDFYRIAQKWVEFVPRVHKEHPHLLAEMFAYCIAASHLHLPHVVMDSLMVSDQGISKGEGWDFLEGVPSEDVCKFAADTVNMFQYNTAKENYDESKHKLWTSEEDMVKAQIPNVLHLCQRYMVGEWFFGKRKLPTDYFTCESPILQTPPPNLATMYNYRIRPGDPRDQHIPLSPILIKKSTFMICAATKALQDASTYFKSQYCTNPNMREDLNLFELFYK